MGSMPDTLNIKQRILLSDRNIFQPAHSTVVFLVRPELETMDWIINQRDHWKKPEDKEVHVVFVPRRTIECDERLLKNDLFAEERVS